MKTTKAKTTSKPKMASGAGKSVKSKKVTTIKSGPSVEDIRAKAQEIYNERMARGEHGTAEGDWHKAEQFFKSAKK